MKLIGENIHIISKTVRAALAERNEAFIKDLILKEKTVDTIDLNVGPAKAAMEGILPWLCNLVQENSNLSISFDSTNAEEIEKGLNVCSDTENAFINSTSADSERLEKITTLAKKYNSNMIALTMNKEIGIPKTADERLALAFEIMETCDEKKILHDKIYFDPLILPISVEQSQAQEAINTIQMIKQSFEPEVKTTVGLSNISNGSPKEIRPLINRVFAVLLYGAGLDSAIIDALDTELIRIIKMLDNQNPQNKIDELYINIANTIRDFSEIEEISYNEQDSNQVAIIKTANILLNKSIYSHSYLQI
ncbi:MAG: dihydropteroate synthase [bacterium]|nr:dihydropteroate synthase [bacterium]